MKMSTGLAITAVVLFSGSAFQIPSPYAVENPKWLFVRDFMSVVEKEARTREVALESGLMPEFTRLSNEQRRLMSLAREIDEALRLEMRRRVEVESEATALRSVRQRAHDAAQRDHDDRYRWLLSEKVALEAASRRGEEVGAREREWRRRNLEYERLKDRLSEPWGDSPPLPEWADEYAPGVGARWQRYSADNNRLISDSERRFDRETTVFLPGLEAWEGRLDAMASRLRAEADRISSILPPGSTAPAPVSPTVPMTAGTEPPLRTIDPEVSPRGTLATASVELARAMEEPFQEYAVRLANHGVWVGHLIQGVPTPPVVSVALTGSLVVDSLLDMGIRSEEERQRAEEERLRRSLPNIMRESPIIQEMDRLNRELEPLVVAGTWTREQKRDLMTSRARAMVAEASLGEQDFRVRALNAFFTADAAYEALKIVASNTMAYRIGSALGSVEGGRPADVRVAEFVGWTTGNITSDILDAARRIQDEGNGR